MGKRMAFIGLSSVDTYLAWEIIRMRAIRLAGLLTLTLTLFGCGGSSNSSSPPPSSPPPPPPAASGVLAGPVVGVAYKTATRSGVTDAAGRFLYLPGEAVTFSIGGLVFGTISGAATVNLFELAGAQIPDTEAELRSELQTTARTTPFDTAVNMAVTLSALDSDADPGNGFDVSGWDAVLATANLSFERDATDFYQRWLPKFSRRHGAQRTVDARAALVQLYESLRIRVAAETLTVRRIDADGIDDSIDVFSYDSTGRQIRQEADDDGDGVVDRVFTYLYFGGRQTVAEVLEDVDNDGVPDITSSRKVTVYDAENRRLSSVEQKDSDLDGAFDSVDSEFWTYDAAGNEVIYLLTKDSDADGVVDRSETVTREFSSEGNMLRETTLIDSDYDGVNDEQWEAVQTFSAANFRESRIDTFDTDADGSADTVQTFTYTYDTADFLIEEYRSIDLAADGTMDLGSRDTTAYNTEQQPTLVRSETLNSVNQPISIRESRYAYDTQGNLRVRVAGTDSNADGALDACRTNTQYSYDAGDNRISSVFVTIDDATGLPKDRVTTSLDTAGNVLGEVSDRDDNSDGVLDYQSTTRYDRDPGSILERKVFDEDVDRDGVVDVSIITTYEYDTLPDGLWYILNDLGFGEREVASIDCSF